jgi:hypothetical protein
MIQITIREIILICNGIDGVFLKLCMYLPNNLCCRWIDSSIYIICDRIGTEIYIPGFIAIA